MFKKIVDGLGKLFGVAENLSDPEQYDIKTIKRLKYQLEAAQNYIFVDEMSGEYGGMKESKLKKWKLHFRKRAFDSN
jgi:hypothetical protein